MKRILVALMAVSVLVANCAETIKTDTSCNNEKIVKLENFIAENPEVDAAQLFLQAMKESCEKENNTTKESK